MQASGSLVSAYRFPFHLVWAFLSLSLFAAFLHFAWSGPPRVAGVQHWRRVRIARALQESGFRLTEANTQQAGSDDLLGPELCAHAIAMTLRALHATKPRASSRKASFGRQNYHVNSLLVRSCCT
jgi:hypothetical protein